MIDLTWLFDLVARLMPFEVMQARFMQQALVALVLLAPMCAAMGVQVVNFRMAFFSDAISHTAFAGVAVGMLAGVDYRLSMVVFAVAVGLGIMALGRKLALSFDTVIGVFFAAVIAFGLAIVSRNRHVARSMQAFLYGDILTIGQDEILLLMGLFVALMVFQAAGYNRMLYLGVSPRLASAHRIRVRVYQYLFAALLSLVVIFSVWAVGVLLVTAMLVVPAAAARNFAHSAAGMFWWALVVGTTSAVVGLVLSAQPWANCASGAAVVLCASAWFVVSLLPAILQRRRAD